MEQFVSKYAPVIEAAFQDYYKKYPEPARLYDPVRYILSLGGKRIRPALVLLAAESFGCPVERAMNAALAIEVFHNFSLVHDDMMDHAPLRRGHRTVHNRWDENTAILSGDVMMIQAYELFEAYEGKDFRDIVLAFNRVARLVCEGQQLDMDYEREDDVTIDRYMKMIGLKTAVLLGGALKIGGIVAHGTQADLATLYDFGYDIGIAFQLTDDYLDTFGNQDTFGKRIGGDILERKKTFLYIKALEKAGKDALDEAYAGGDETRWIESVRDLYVATGADKALEEAIAEYTARALAGVERMPFSPEYKGHYAALARKLVDRKL